MKILSVLNHFPFKTNKRDLIKKKMSLIEILSNFRENYLPCQMNEIIFHSVQGSMSKEILDAFNKNNEKKLCYLTSSFI